MVAQPRGQPPGSSGKLVALGRIKFAGLSPESSLVYRAMLLKAPPGYPAESLAAVDSTDDPRFAHELRLIPLHSVGSRHPLGNLQFNGTNVGIPAFAAAKGV